MENLILIGAVGKNGELGKDNKLIWYIPDDLKFFKEVTINHTVVMGYNTFVSLPKMLVDRKHIVLTRKKIRLPDDVVVFSTKEDVISYAKENDEDIFIIGGASVYNQFIDDVDKMYLTEIDAQCDESDVYFPKFDKNDWDKEVIKEKEYKDLSYRHVLYKRKK